MAFNAATVQSMLMIANIDGLCASVCPIAASNGERYPVRTGVWNLAFGCFWTNVLCYRVGPWGVRTRRGFAAVCTRGTPRLSRAEAAFVWRIKGPTVAVLLQ